MMEHYRTKNDLTQDLRELDQARKRFDRAWSFLMILFLVGLGAYLMSGKYCDFLGTDFRGYYATAQITRQAGVGHVYDPQLQAERQAMLTLRCPDGSHRSPLVNVLVPYLPVFVPLFLPLSWLDMTASYLLWDLVNLAVLVVYLHRFSIAITGRVNYFKLFQWMICFPVLANLALGQVNVLLVVFLGEFTLAFLRGRLYFSGAWAGFLLLKPHLLILVLPGLLIARRWRTLPGIVASLIVLLAASFFLAGADGMSAWWNVIRSFSEPSFISLPNMMNSRALAFNLARFIPGWAAWLAVIALMVAIILSVLYLWARSQLPWQFICLMLATLAGTFVLSWHANLYLWICLVPYLLVLDMEDQVPVALLGTWIYGPPAIYFLVYMFSPGLAHPALGIVMLGFNLFLLGFSARHRFSP
jgi:hypothetical protein